MDIKSFNTFNKGINEDKENSRYMLFSNLEQIRRQAGLLLDMNEEDIEKIIENGHDWAQDHIAVAKENMDQVFDFLMNETKSGDMWKSVDLEDREDIMNQNKLSDSESEVYNSDEPEETQEDDSEGEIKSFNDFK
jgi:tRNA(Ile)-lysidine synthase TilS/MesJ